MGGTFGNECNNLKTEIKQALEGKLVTFWHDDGSLETVEGTKEQCDAVILMIFDHVVDEGLMALTSGRTLERMFKDATGKDPDIREYARISAEEALKYSDYIYEEDPEDEDELD